MIDASRYPLLSTIDSPADLRALPRERLAEVSDELRAYLIECISQSGGHFSSNLGAVELTVALHYALNTPKDKLVWDVGHQSYAHKVLTGRRDQLKSIRHKDGLAPFPKREESEYDSFGVGHSSTSISAVLGMGIAAQIKGEDTRSVAVIGDGAMTAGMAFEALNHAGTTNANVLVILNDNEMSISPNIGALTQYFTRLLTSHAYNASRSGIKKLLTPLPPLTKLAKRLEEHVKGMLTPGALFEAFGFQYFGPVDGHDVDTLTDVLQNTLKIPGPILLHVVTQKGKGYKLAEDEQIKYHGVSTFDPEQGITPSSPANSPTYTQVFSQWINDAAANPHITAITPAMREGSGLVEFEQNYPERYFDVGIAEQHAVTLAAGMACDGLRPIVAIYSTFLQRAYDQAIHDVAVQNLPVLFAIDRAGLVGHDGATHSGNYDISFLRCLPNFVIMTPSNEDECRKLLNTGIQYNGPSTVRYPRGKGPGVAVDNTLEALPIGKARIVRQGQKTAILAFGPVLQNCLPIAEQLDATLVDMRFVKPLDQDCIKTLTENHTLFITVEENAIAGGAGSGVSEWLNQQGINTAIHHIGIPDCYIEHGTQHEALADAGLDAEGIERQIKACLVS